MAGFKLKASMKPKMGVGKPSPKAALQKTVKRGKKAGPIVKTREQKIDEMEDMLGDEKF